MPHPVIIDTDAGVDDALALILAMHSPEISVKMITTVAGNVEVYKCTNNVHRILHLLKIKNPPPVIEGAKKPLQRSLVTAPEVHGRDGLGNTQLGGMKHNNKCRNKAIDAILRCCSEYKNRLIIIALGPLTNLALTLKKNPSALKKIRRIISMGGAFCVSGNTSSVAEFNYYVDPEAAELVLNSGLPITLIPLDVTEQVILMRRQLEFEAAKRRSILSDFLLKTTKDYMLYHLKTRGFNGGYLHYPLAVAAAVDPLLIETKSLKVHIETNGKHTRGMTIINTESDKRTRPIQVAMRVRRERFLSLFNKRLWK